MLTIDEHDKLINEIKGLKKLTLKNVIEIIKNYTSRQSIAVDRSKKGVEIRKPENADLLKDAVNRNLNVAVMTQGLSEASDEIKKKIKKAY